MERVNDKSPVNNHGFTPLDAAACFGHFDICKRIVANMTDVTPEEGEMKLKNLIRKILATTERKNKKTFEIHFWSLFLQQDFRALNPRPLRSANPKDNSKLLFMLDYCIDFIVNNS